MFCIFYLASQYLSQTFGTSTGIFGTKLPNLPRLSLKLPATNMTMSSSPRNIFDYRKKKIDPPPVKIKKPPKKEPKPIVKKDPAPVKVVTGDFTSLSLLGIHREGEKQTALWEYTGMIYVTVPGQKFGHFRLVSLSDKGAEVEDTGSRIRKKYSLDI